MANKKSITLSSGDSVECFELDVGQIRTFRAECKEDEFEAGLNLIKVSAKKDDKFINKLNSGDAAKLIQFIVNAENWTE